MNEQTFQFLKDEMLIAEYEGQTDRLKQFKAIHGYLEAAKKLREGYERYDVPRNIERFDLDCARVSP